MKNMIMSFRNASISLHKVPILSGVYLDILEQGLTGIIYENEIEKEVFIQLFMGRTELDGGTLYRGGAGSPGGGWFIGSESNLLNSLSIGEQLFGFTSAEKFKIKKNYDPLVHKLYQEFAVRLPSGSDILNLTEWEKITIELLMAYTLKKDLIVLAGIAAILNADELRASAKLINMLRQRGKTFILLDSYENILLEKADQIYILKGGQTVQFLSGDEVSRERIYQTLEPAKKTAVREQREPCEAESIFSFRDVTTDQLEHVSLNLQRGEICKILDYDISRLRHMANLFLGETKIKSGEMVYDHKPFIPRGYEDVIRKKIGIVPMNPIEKLLFGDLTVKMNLFYPLSRKAPEVLRFLRFEKSVKETLKGSIPPQMYNRKVRELRSIEHINIVYAKWYLYFPKLLICINPFHNFNVEMDQVIEKWLVKMTERGTAVVILSPQWLPHLSLRGKEVYLRDWLKA